VFTERNIEEDARRRALEIIEQWLKEEEQRVADEHQSRAQDDSN
jgi:hypothetical protein